jgi:perosamine synthetase
MLIFMGIMRLLMKVNKDIVRFIRELYEEDEAFIPLHAPVFLGNEKKYLADCIDTTFVSYVGKYVTQFESQIAQFTGAKYAVAMVNGTTALQIALQLAGVSRGHEVITQALSFVATANAISHAGGIPVFIDVDQDTLGMSPVALLKWLESNSKIDRINNRCINKNTGRVISAIVPMHTFGHPCYIEEIMKIANNFGIEVVEDAAESLGSYYEEKHTGTFGLLGILSFNGNKTITTGGGGMIITDDEALAKKAKHITTTAKVPHPWEFVHDEIGYNYRMNNVCAAIGVAQMEKIDDYLANKLETASRYHQYFEKQDIEFVHESKKAKSNYWLNAIMFSSLADRNQFLKYSNQAGVMTRPAWVILSDLEMYSKSDRGTLENSIWISERVVNLPSSYRFNRL